MSYEIVYERQFLKSADGKIISLALYGCNNLYDHLHSRERRVRSWNPIFAGQNQNIAQTADELRAVAKSWTGGEFQEHFMHRGKWVDDAALLRFAENGIRNAKTIEELDLQSVYKISLTGSLSVWRKNQHMDRTELTCTIRNSADLDDFLTRAQDRLDHRDPDEQIFVQLKFPGEKAVEFPRPKPKPKPPIRYWAIKVKQLARDAYLSKLTPSKIVLTSLNRECKKFRTESDVRKWVEQHRVEERFQIIWEPIFLDEEAAVSASTTQ